MAKTVRPIETGRRDLSSLSEEDQVAPEANEGWLELEAIGVTLLDVTQPKAMYSTSGLTSALHANGSADVG